MHANNAKKQTDTRRLEYSISSTTYVHIIHYRSLYFISLYLSSCAPALFMIITAVINIHNVILVLFSISTCAISFIILLRFCLLFIHIIFAHIFCPHICFRNHKQVFCLKFILNRSITSYLSGI